MLTLNYTPLKLNVNKKDVELTLWIKTILFSLILLVFVCIYLYVSTGEIDKHALNRAFGVVSVLLIGISLSLSGICYFWAFAESKIIYRKHLGITGFFYALMHAVISFFFLPSGPPLSFYLDPSRLLPFLFGLSALIIFFVMTVISNRFSITHLGGKLWRRIMHAGYLAYTLVVVHVLFLNKNDWKNLLTLIPLSIIIFFLIVVGLRAAIEISKSRKTKVT